MNFVPLWLAERIIDSIYTARFQTLLYIRMFRLYHIFFTLLAIMNASNYVVAHSIFFLQLIFLFLLYQSITFHIYNNIIVTLIHTIVRCHARILRRNVHFLYELCDAFIYVIICD